MKDTTTSSQSGLLETDTRWAAIRSRDERADGAFVYAVKTTGVYCRPSCSARKPRPENVAIFSGPANAERAGYRPCKRCRPDEAGGGEARTSSVARACREIERADSPPSLDHLAEQAGLSPNHLRRLFKRATGLTPRQYATQVRIERVRGSLAGSGSVTQAVFDSGYQSSSRFYEDADAMLGMTPGEYRRGAHGADVRFAVADCSLGCVLVAQSDRGICAISLGDDAERLVRELKARFPHARLLGDDEDFGALVAAVVAFIEEPRAGLELPLDIRGTAFQQRVWRALREIPAGDTVSYSELAERIASPTSARAVAGACAANQLAVAVPCHRVVHADGTMSGYRWGVERKKRLLDREIG